MIGDVVPYLRCPVCGLPVAAGDRALRCERGHSFDIAKQGYVNLSAGRAPHAGDTAEMVAARDEFLRAGRYGFISAALAAAAREAAPDPGLVVDAGAGTGGHLGVVLDALPGAVGLALDVSKPALRRAARAHPRAGAALCDTWGRLPVGDHAAGLLLNVFAPRNGAEFARLLRRDGALLVVTPAADHLAELVETLGLLRVDPEKAERVAASLAGRFTLEGEQTHRRTLRLSHAEVRTLVGMGPSAWHADGDRLAAGIAALAEPVPVTAAIRLGVYRLS
ncbi:23S rRNA m(1)G-748 methyltransferase [Micromonospora pattaloongensis]|uniref:23S rRNA m(1)G-748 methyltransferase n=1 Tax=Micromonospora pattaloongensis TaxID=405436 RepID=A0A1H3GI15_9ACTN|nr:23S rRNA methyltransferase [Micromonospora pattaloongensis]SDY02278.1 23S rRNA m(1)G-748 methyltransferase [Micromonospora pattaloongensis]